MSSGRRASERGSPGGMSTADGTTAGVDFFMESHDGSDIEGGWFSEGDEFDVFSASKRSRNFWISGSFVRFDELEVVGMDGGEGVVDSFSVGTGVSSLSGEAGNDDDQGQPIVNDAVEVNMDMILVELAELMFQSGFGLLVMLRMSMVVDLDEGIELRKCSMEVGIRNRLC